jgi:hypothetical protein
MTKRRLSREAAALLPWIGAAFLWFGLIAPMRAGEESRLTQQSRTRRDRLKAERSLRETQAMRARIGGAIASACRASTDPATLRQRAVAATSGLSLAPFSLSVTGGAEGGASIEASGTRGAALELLKRLGDPARGGFLRSVTIKEKGERWSVSAITGVFESFPGGVISAPPVCAGVSDSGPGEAAPEVGKPSLSLGRAPVRPLLPSARPGDAATVMPAIEPAPAAPFALVAFLVSEGKTRVSIRVREEVRVISVGESVDGWKCLSIDRDEGVVFTSPSQERLILKAAPSGR